MTNYRFLFPVSPFNSKVPDDAFADEMRLLMEANIACSLWHGNDVYSWKMTPPILPGEVVVCRGWMMRVSEYQEFAHWVGHTNASMLSSVEGYARCHLLPGWYSAISDLTAPTIILPDSPDLVAMISGLGQNWPGYFVKDYVKSLTTKRGSIAQSPEEALDILQLLKQYRGSLEGGACLRRLESFVANSERRYFVIKGTPYAAEGDVPDIVSVCAKRIQAPFFSVDVAELTSGSLQIVEIGDGQVSDTKHWDTEKFVKTLLEALAIPPTVPVME